MTPQAFTEWDSAVGVRRTLVLGITLWMTWRSFLWATQYAAIIPAGEGANAALVIAAVLAPVAALQAFVFRIYADSKT